jgi:hypothetical protein
MENMKKDIDELTFIKSKIDNIEKIVYTDAKAQKVVYNMLVEYKSCLNDLTNTNKEISKRITSVEDKINKLLELINNEIAGDTPSSKRCQYSDKQLYNMHYGLGYKKKYSLTDLEKLTGMSRSFVQQHIRKYSMKVDKEV